MPQEKQREARLEEPTSPIFEEQRVGDDYVEEDSTSHLSQELRDYLMKTHGTLNLEPLPSLDPADPYNWPSWQKNLNVCMISFHSMMTGFTASAIIPAYEAIAADLGGSITKASYLTSAQIVVMGMAPLLWKPVSNRYGRRPMWLTSTLGSLVCNIGCAKSHSYGAMMVMRILSAFFISPPLAIGTAVVFETFFKHQRGQKMGLWTLMSTLGPLLGPFFMGFVAYQLNDYRWILWILVMINGVQFLLYFFFSPESLYMRSPPLSMPPKRSAFREYFCFKRIDPTPLKAIDFYGALLMGKHVSVLVPAISHAVVFGFASVLMTVEIPELFAPKFDFNAQQIGLQFIAMIIGTVIGEQFSGPLSDMLMNRKTKKLGIRPPPEYRLWASYLGFLTVIVGSIVFGVQLQNIETYNVSPVVGTGISAFGNQVVTTVLITYAVDCNPDASASVGVFIILARQTWGFIGPFWFPPMFDSLGIAKSMGLCCGIMAAASVLPIVLLQWHGSVLHSKKMDVA